MTENLKRIAAALKKVLAALEGLSVRPTLELMVRRGELLIAAKAEAGHGGWLDWLACVKVKPRQAQRWMAIARRANTTQETHLPQTLDEVVPFVQAAARDGRRRERKERRELLAAEAEKMPPDKAYRLECADCRSFGGWPARAGLIVADPPWQELSHYEWLGAFARRRLAPGGLLLVQCGQPELAAVLPVLGRSGLAYLWTLAIVFQHQTLSDHVNPLWMPAWRPVLVYSSGKPRRWEQQCQDRFLVGRRPKTEAEAHWHPWAIPPAPWAYWLGILSEPGDLVLDPFAGAGTVGRVVRGLGQGRRYLGTEVDAKNAAAARAEIGRTVEGGGAK